MNPKPLPDSVSNAEQTELKGTLSFSVRAFHIFSVPSLVIQSMDGIMGAVGMASNGELSSVAVQGKQDNGFLSKLSSAAINYGKTLAIEYINEGVTFAKSYANDLIYNKLESMSATNIANKVLSFTQPSIMMQKYGRQAETLLNNILNNDTRSQIESMYFTDKLKVDTSAELTGDTEFFNDKRKV
jgi:ethanolamine utilization protein EutP (predicted NTPase)